MDQGFVKILIVLILCKTLTIIYCQRTWTYDFTDIKFQTNNPDIIDGEYKVDRISRGVFGISGYIDIKQAIDDRSSIEVNFYRDKLCNKNYVIQPYSLSNTTLTNGMNDYYKQHLMDTLQKCGENAPYFKEFTPPLGPVYVIFNKCQISTDNMPSYMSEGCYLVSVNIYGQVQVKISAYSVVEQDTYFI